MISINIDSADGETNGHADLNLKQGHVGVEVMCLGQCVKQIFIRIVSIISPDKRDAMRDLCTEAFIRGLNMDTCEEDSGESDKL